MISEKTIDKLCNRCGERKDFSHFHKSSRGCSNGLVSQCKQCKREINQERYLRIRETMLSEKAKQYKENPDKFKLRRLHLNKLKYRIYGNNWRLRNKHTVLSNNALRRARKQNATPNWLTIGDRKRMAFYYLLAKKLEAINNCFYHVDHIVPLTGTDVCGLHVPWNLQIITAEENLQKYNKLQQF